MNANKLSSEFSSDFIRTEANKCVSCGLCLPHCPTYQLLKTEADSPRGRIAMMHGVASGRIPLNERFIQHMDRCLACRACESVCPNHVAYGRLIDEARVMLQMPESTLLNLPENVVRKKKSRWRMFAERELIAKPVRFDRLRLLCYFLQKSGLQQWLQKSTLLRKTKFAKLAAQLPVINSPRFAYFNDKKIGNKVWQEIYPAEGKQRGEVGLFLGCVARLADFITLNSAIFVLNRLGYTVHVPLTQTCCGALHQHSGDTKTAAEFAGHNKQAFEGLNINTIISTASGCGVQLAEHFVDGGRGKVEGLDQLSLNLKNSSSPDGTRQDRNKELLPSITDISKFLVTAEGWEDVEISSLPLKVAVHEPCSLRNVKHDQAYPYELILRIPDVQVTALAGNNRCCGAAGTYFLDQPGLARMLLDDKISALAESGARYLVTSNIGCALHIVSGAREVGLDLEVLHPATLLARQMGIQ